MKLPEKLTYGTEASTGSGMLETKQAINQLIDYLSEGEEEEDECVHNDPNLPFYDPVNKNWIKEKEPTPLFKAVESMRKIDGLRGMGRSTEKEISTVLISLVATLRKEREEAVAEERERFYKMWIDKFGYEIVMWNKEQGKPICVYDFLTPAHSLNNTTANGTGCNNFTAHPLNNERE